MRPSFDTVYTVEVFSEVDSETSKGSVFVTRFYAAALAYLGQGYWFGIRDLSDHRLWLLKAEEDAGGGVFTLKSGPDSYRFERLTMENMLRSAGSEGAEIRKTFASTEELQAFKWVDIVGDAFEETTVEETLASAREWLGISPSEKLAEAAFPVGTVRTWKGVEMVKVSEAPAKWMPVKDVPKKQGGAKSSGKKWPKSTLMANLTESGFVKKKRRDLWRKIRTKVLDSAVSVPEGVQPQAIMTMGTPASGKSTAMSSSGLQGRMASGVAHIDPDRIKEDLPEYREAIEDGFEGAASMVQGESGAVAELVRRAATRTRRNLVFEAVGGDSDWFPAMCAKTKEAGHRVSVVATDLPDVEIAISRARERASREGRHVPEDYIRRVYGEIPKSFAKLRDIADDLVLYNTDERPPKLVYKKSDGVEEILDPEYFSAFLKRGGVEESVAVEEKSATLESVPTEASLDDLLSWFVAELEAPPGPAPLTPPKKYTVAEETPPDASLLDKWDAQIEADDDDD